MILVGKVQYGQQPEKVLHTQIEGLNDIKRYKAHTLELKRIENEQEFYETVILEVLDDIVANIGPDLDNDWFLEQVWNYAQGHWDFTTIFATVLNDKLETSRIITQEIAQQVFDFLMPKLGL